MIYLFHGTDVDKVRTKAFEWVATARKKEPNLAYARLAREELTDSALVAAAQSGGLFVKRMLVLSDDPYPATRAKAEEESEDDEEEASENPLEENLEALAKSDNAIVILAPKLPVPKQKKFLKHAKLEYKFDAKERAMARGFNSALVNALASKNREMLWLEVVRAQAAGDAPEMLHGLLHWKARDLMEKGSRSWKPEEARNLSMDLIGLLQETRRRGGELGRELERWALRI